jgi:hypothetical protein
MYRYIQFLFYIAKRLRENESFMLVSDNRGHQYSKTFL